MDTPLNHTVSLLQARQKRQKRLKIIVVSCSFVVFLASLDSFKIEKRILSSSTYRRDLTTLTIHEQLRFFRFSFVEINDLLRLLKIPSPFRCRNRYKVDAHRALCVTLYRLSVSRTLFDIAFFLEYIKTLLVSLLMTYLIT